MTKLFHFCLIPPLLLLLFLLSLPFYETIFFLIDFLHLSFEDLILLLFTAFFSFSFYFLQSCFQYLFPHPWVLQSNPVWQPIPACCPLVTISVSCYILTPSAYSIFTFALSPLECIIYEPYSQMYWLLCYLQMSSFFLLSYKLHWHFMLE